VKLATYNVNGVNGRLEVLLRWMDEAEPDVVLDAPMNSKNCAMSASAL
jgi:exodeoxyribonuclease-3